MTPIEKYWHGTEYNDTPPEMGVTIRRANVTGIYARCVVIHLLTREENMGNHNFYLDVIDQHDKRLDGSLLLGRNNNISLFSRIDKPPNEFGTNFSVYTQDTVNAWVGEATGFGAIPSDTVLNFSTRWGGPIVGGQDYGHISIYAIWQIISGTPIPPIPPVDCEQLRLDYAALLVKYGKLNDTMQEIKRLANQW